MIASRAAANHPTVLIVDDRDWSSEALEAVLTPNGYSVTRATSGRQALPFARRYLPDLVFINMQLAEHDGVALCRNIRLDPVLGESIPVLLTSADPVPQNQLLSAFQAGAWEVITFPIDVAVLLLRIDSFVRAKRQVDRAREQSLIDEATGLYNFRGLEQRAREIRGQTHRDQKAMACVVLAPDVSDSDATDKLMVESAVNRLATVLRTRGRASDAIGRLGQYEFAVVAPNTDGPGAVRLAKRIAASLDAAASTDNEPRAVRLLAGYDILDSAAYRPGAATELLTHATVALRGAYSSESGHWIRAFERDQPATSDPPVM